MMYLQGLIILLLIAIAWQDYKFRAVYWWLFVLLIAVLAVIKSITIGFETMLIDFGYNLIFLSLQFLLLFIYFCIKQGRMVNLFNGFFGLGDLLFLISIAAYFSLLNYILFYTFSLLLIVMLNAIKNLFNQHKTVKIPLAGQQAIVLIVVLIVTHFKATTDMWSINSLIN